MKPVVLTIMDGVGLAKPSSGNAYDLAKKPNLDEIFSKYPTTTLDASGKRVGLPDGQMGNSEVGHMNIGAGRVVFQQLELINNSFEESRVGEIENYQELIKFANNNNKVIHLMGMLSDGGVHSHINHIIALIDLISKEDITLYIHNFYDGRDVAPMCAEKYLKVVEEKISNLDNVSIATGSGRFYAMDRDSNFDRIEKAYNAIVEAKGPTYNTAIDGLKDSYSNDIYDEQMIPYVIKDYPGASDGDAFLFANFRPDRAIEISSAIIDDDFDGFMRKQLNNIFYATMTKYTRVDSKVLFGPTVIKNGLGEYLANNGYKQLRIAETEKYAHVTFFFDGGEEKDYDGMTKSLVNSPKVKSYDMQPEMSALQVTQNVLNELDNDYDVVILNFANPDMVGHTGNIEATIKAVETVDACIGKVFDKVKQIGGVMIITADHGNSEYMLDEKGEVVTSHSTNLVPLCVTSEVTLKDNMSLCDIAPTMLQLLGCKQPEEMTGYSIIEEEK